MLCLFIFVIILKPGTFFGLTEEGELTVTVDTWKMREERVLTWKTLIGLVRKLRHRHSGYLLSSGLVCSRV